MAEALRSLPSASVTGQESKTPAKSEAEANTRQLPPAFLPPTPLSSAQLGLLLQISLLRSPPPGINGLFLIHQPVLLSITPLHQPPPPPASENLRRNPPCSLMNSTVIVHKLCLRLGLLIGINAVNKARKHQSWLCCWEGIKKKKKSLSVTRTFYLATQ